MVKSILLVDDNPINNFLNLRLLNKLGVADEIKVCENGLDALDYLISLKKENLQAPDLILLDTNMPLLNGFEFLKACHVYNINLKEETKIVVLAPPPHFLDNEELEEFNYPIVSNPLTEENIFKILSTSSSNKKDIRQ